MHFRYRLLMLAIFCCGGLYAQNCNYQLVLEDSFGDGWDGAELLVRVDGVVTTYTVTDDPAIDNGFRRVIFFPVSDGQTLEIGFVEGAFANEHSFFLLDNADEELYVSTSPIEEGETIFSTTVACATCFAPPANSIELFRVRSTTVDYKFNGGSAAADPVYRIEFRDGDTYDPSVDMDGVALITQDTMGRISGLEPDTSYVFWISTICQADMDTTNRRGPFLIRTQKQTDVGITALRGPVSDCDLGSEEVTIGITNFGGEPQAFFNVDYMINGQPAGVSRPADGIFTGIVGVDSTEFFTFDTRALLSAPGTYELMLWTELEGDEDTSNDTFTVFITHTPLISELPYVENFEENDGFWSPTREEFANDNSFAWGAPNGAIFDRAPQGSFAWATGLDTRYNNNERSLLNSPCFDFTDLEEDPLFSAILRMNIETNFDQFTLEMTKDEGETWEKIETGPGTTNWYNNLASQYWTNEGGFPAGGPTMVSAVLSGAAGEEIQLRFRFRSDGSVTREGILVDVVSITERYDQDLAAVTGNAFSEVSCGSETDTVSFSFTNRGGEIATGFDLSYRVNGGDVVTETFAGELAPGQSATYQFNTAFNSTLVVENRIEAWVSLADDELVANDTTFYFFRSLSELPFFLDFENGAAPAGWDLGGGAVAQLFGSPSIGVAENLFSAIPNLTFSTSNYGLVEVGDELRMDFVFREFSSSALYTGPVDLEIRAYPDCSESFQILEVFTARGDTTIVRDLSVYAGRSLRFEVVADWINGDFNLTVDNIGVIRCSGLELDASTEGVSAMDVADGSATVIPNVGFPPYTFLWNTGDSTATVEELAFGDYSVTVTDTFGCAETIEFMIDLASGTDRATEVLEGISVFPNPTSGQISLQLDLPSTTVLRATVYDLTGRKLLDRDYGRQLQLNETFDLSAYPAGVYLLRVQADDAAKTVRIMKN